MVLGELLLRRWRMWKVVVVVVVMMMMMMMMTMMIYLDQRRFCTASL